MATRLAAFAAALLLSACGGRQAADSTTKPPSDPFGLPDTTAAAAGPVPKVTWALYRQVKSLDPATAFDYPENTVIATLCDSLLRQQPDGSLAPGLASAYSYPTPTALQLTLRPDARFWDGSPVTAADVVFSLNRHLDPETGSFYGANLERISGISASGDTVTISLSKPDYWLAGELSAMPGVVVQERYARAKGRDFGTAAGGTMCSGPYKLAGWEPGAAVRVAARPDYWDAALRPLAQEIAFRGVSDAATLTTGLTTGEIDGSWITDTSNLAQLRRNPSINVHLGPSMETQYFIPANLTGVLGDVRVRRALSLAFDRRTYISATYGGDAFVPRMATNPGTWGFAKPAFRAAWDAAPELSQDLEQAKKLISEAGATGKPLVIGTSTGLATVATQANAWLQAANAIGLKASLHNVSPENYINFFTDPGARAAVDAFSTTTYGDYADPAALANTFIAPNGSQNYSGYQNHAILTILENARAEADPARRAQLDIDADKLIMRDLPWIPLAHPPSVLALNRKLTGVPTSFVYMQAPWLAKLGAAAG
ncbi:ABC transporter substrate-binding protein [Amycolatopsis xylanica]|uniref:ABC transporter substrate-binding protein n=1 Tax=Amycolatopsis xylanica TaxID=589385 RepID=UPI0015A0E59C|nr:ABC transporter substrate-binding protein [Amycolatopsis xylanica]